MAAVVVRFGRPGTGAGGGSGRRGGGSGWEDMFHCCTCKCIDF